MPALLEQTIASQRQMSALRKSLTTPQFWLGAFLGLLLAVLGDTCRNPSRQVSPVVYSAILDGYRWTRSQVASQPRCRFYPTCSKYSEQAVRRYGLWKGLRLTFERIRRCRTSVPLNTFDPVPDLHGSKVLRLGREASPKSA